MKRQVAAMADSAVPPEVIAGVLGLTGRIKDKVKHYEKPYRVGRRDEAARRAFGQAGQKMIAAAERAQRRRIEFVDDDETYLRARVAWYESLEALFRAEEHLGRWNSWLPLHMRNLDDAFADLRREILRDRLRIGELTYRRIVAPPNTRSVPLKVRRVDPAMTREPGFDPFAEAA